MTKHGDMGREKSQHKDNKKRLMRNILIIVGEIVLASILGAISGKFLLDNII